MLQHLEPAARIIAALGGVADVADFVGLDEASVRRWRLPRPTGTGGVIPEAARQSLLEMAAERGVPLTYAAFDPGQPAAIANTS